MAGLSAGIYARLNGFDSEIVEIHSLAGGLCTAWYRKQYRFDYSVQWLVGTRYGTFFNTYKETNVINDDVKILNADFHTRMVLPDGSDFLVYANIDKWQEYLLEKAPEDEKSIRKMCKDMHSCRYLNSFDLAPSLRNPLHYIKALFDSFPTLMTIVKYRKKSFYDYVSNLKFKNDWLRNSLLSLYGKTDFSAVAFLLILGWYTNKNAGYPIGGSLALAERMYKRYTDLGGKFTFKKEVKDIIVENNVAKGVVLDDGTVLEADYVISAGDGYNTIFNLLKGKYTSSKVKSSYEKWSPFCSFVQVSFGVNKKLETKYPVQLVLATGRKIGSTVLSQFYRILNYNFDSTMAPENKTCIVIRFDSPYDQWKNMDRNSEEYKQEKERIKADALKILDENYPGSSEFVEICDIATPLTTVRYTKAWKGSYEGFRPTSKNITDQLSLTLPGLDKFYMVGHWLFPGGGIPPSIQSGKWAIQMICKKEKVKFINNDK